MSTFHQFEGPSFFVLAILCVDKSVDYYGHSLNEFVSALCCQTQHQHESISSWDDYDEARGWGLLLLLLARLAMKYPPPSLLITLNLKCNHKLWNEIASGQQTLLRFTSLALPTNARWILFLCLPFRPGATFSSANFLLLFLLIIWLVEWWLLISILWRKRVPCRNWLWCLSSSVISLNTRWIIFHFLAW